MKVIQTVAYVGDESSGPAYSVPNLCNALGNNGVDVSFYALAPMPPMPKSFKSFSYPRHSFPHPSFGRSPEMFTAMKQACHDSDVMHNHCLWMAPSIYAEKARRKTACKLVMSPRGSLAEWALKRSRLKKFLIWHYGQKATLMDADLLHATGEKEYNEIRAFGLKQPVMLLPNGIDIPEFPIEKDLNGKRKLTFLGRIHPVKAIDNLLEAWHCLEDKFPDWELDIVGPMQSNYSQQLKKNSVELGLKRVNFRGELNGLDKENILYNSQLFVLPSHTENFGMVVAEALACGTPVITTKGTPWNSLEKKNAGWWIDIGVKPLTACLEFAMTLPDEDLAAMGKNGRELMIRDYLWNEIGKKTKQSYEWLMGVGKKPDWVITN